MRFSIFANQQQVVCLLCIPRLSSHWRLQNRNQPLVMLHFHRDFPQKEERDLPNRLPWQHSNRETSGVYG